MTLREAFLTLHREGVFGPVLAALGIMGSAVLFGPGVNW